MAVEAGSLRSKCHRVGFCWALSSLLLDVHVLTRTFQCVCLEREVLGVSSSYEGTSPVGLGSLPPSRCSATGAKHQCRHWGSESWFLPRMPAQTHCPSRAQPLPGSSPGWRGLTCPHLLAGGSLGHILCPTGHSNNRGALHGVCRAPAWGLCSQDSCT